MFSPVSRSLLKLRDYLGRSEPAWQSNSNQSNYENENTNYYHSDSRFGRNLLGANQQPYQHGQRLEGFGSEPCGNQPVDRDQQYHNLCDYKHRDHIANRRALHRRSGLGGYHGQNQAGHG